MYYKVHLKCKLFEFNFQVKLPNIARQTVSKYLEIQ